MDIFHTRNHRYRISVYFVDDKGNMFGNTEKLIINRDTAYMFLAALSPIKCKTLMNSVNNLRKGGYVSISGEQVEDGIRILKNIRIERN